jgi:hypothetical protein
VEYGLDAMFLEADVEVGRYVRHCVIGDELLDLALESGVTVLKDLMCCLNMKCSVRHIQVQLA